MFDDICLIIRLTILNSKSINWQNAIIGGILGTLLFDLLGLLFTGTWWDIPNLLGSKVGYGLPYGVLGLGRSRMIAKTEVVDYNSSTTVRMEDGEKDKSKNDKRKDIRTKAFEETKLLNFYNIGGIRFNNIATNDAMVKSKLNQMTADGWEFAFVTGGVESSGDKDPNGIYLSRYIFKKPL